MEKISLVFRKKDCMGCHGCEVACKQEHGLGVGPRLVRVLEKSPDYAPIYCHHCSKAPCLEACPEEAIAKREDGIVVMDYGKCTGCQSCMEECPYDAIGFDNEKSLAQKCNLCHHRVDNGLIPACADNVCLAHCIYFGDPDDIQRQINEKHLRRKPGEK